MWQCFCRERNLNETFIECIPLERSARDNSFPMTSVLFHTLKCIKSYQFFSRFLLQHEKMSPFKFGDFFDATIFACICMTTKCDPDFFLFVFIQLFEKSGKIDRIRSVLFNFFVNFTRFSEDLKWWANDKN